MLLPQKLEALAGAGGGILPSAGTAAGSFAERLEMKGWPESNSPLLFKLINKNKVLTVKAGG